MKNRLKRLNKLQIVSLVGLTITLILVLLDVYNTENLFWIFVGLNIFSYVSFMAKWSQDGKTWFSKADKKYTKNLTRKPSDTLLFMAVAYAGVIALIVIADMLIKDFKTTSVISIYIFTIVWNYIGLIVVDKTFKEISTLIESTGKGKRKKQ